MSQLLTPINGGVIQEVQTTTAQDRLTVVSQQYIQVNNLQERPTEWVPGGRPIYRRLPGTSETYQIDFFNIVPNPNTAVSVDIQDIGYVYVPFDGAIYGSNTIEVSASTTNEALLIKSGEIVWKYGSTQVLPTIVDIQLLDVAVGQYEVAYQLVYDDTPIPKLYSVEDFALTGLPLNITSSADGVVGWRYPAVNAFLNTSNNWWANRDSYFPNSNTYSVQPTQSFIQWQNLDTVTVGTCPDGSLQKTALTSAYSQIVLRCPSNTAYTGTATLYYVAQTSDPCASVQTFQDVFVATVDISADTTGQFFQFDIAQPTYNSGWKVVFSSLDMSIQSVTVSGVLTLMEPQAEPSTRAVLVMYPTGSLPQTTLNADGKIIPASYCPLAIVDITNDFKVAKVKDTRYIIHRDYVPVADWLTKPFDEDLIDLYEQVSDYPNLWLAPPSCMKQEYAGLEEDQIVVEN